MISPNRVIFTFRQQIRWTTARATQNRVPFVHDASDNRDAKFNEYARYMEQSRINFAAFVPPVLSKLALAYSRLVTVIVIHNDNDNATRRKCEQLSD